jgi:thiamine-phosphate pyrophosphorylase
LSTSVDYWSIGAVYHTSTKSDAGAPIGTAGFKELAALAPAAMPVIAIGGIDTSNVADILRAGAVGVAVVNAIFGSMDVETAASNLRTTVDEALQSSDP